MIIAPANSSALGGLLALEDACFAPRERWSQTSWQAELDAADRLVLVGRSGDEVIAAASFSVLAETAELLRVAVRPDHGGQGLGRRLVAEGQRWAAQAGAERMLLEVRHDNRAALALYRRTGFAAIAERADYYGPGAHAVVMECPLAGLAGADDTEDVGWAS